MREDLFHPALRISQTLYTKPTDALVTRIRFLAPSEANDELFFNECERTVKKDNTFSFAGIRYETPVDLREKRVTIRYERNRDTRVVVYYKHQRMGAKKLNHLIKTVFAILRDIL